MSTKPGEFNHVALAVDMVCQRQVLLGASLNVFAFAVEALLDGVRTIALLADGGVERVGARAVAREVTNGAKTVGCIVVGS